VGGVQPFGLGQKDPGWGGGPGGARDHKPAGRGEPEITQKKNKNSFYPKSLLLPQKGSLVLSSNQSAPGGKQQEGKRKQKKQGEKKKKKK